MDYKNHSKLEKEKLDEIQLNIINALTRNQMDQIRKYASSENADVRKSVYLILGWLYRDVKPYLKEVILETLSAFLYDKDEKVRQVSIYALREISEVDISALVEFLNKAIDKKMF